MTAEPDLAAAPRQLKLLRLPKPGDGLYASPGAPHGCIPCRDTCSRIADYRELFKVRVTLMVVMTAWAGFYLGSMQSGISSVQPGLIEALFGSRWFQPDPLP